MGEVYQARDIRLRRTVATSALNHPNIAMLYDFGSDNGADYLLLEYAPGQTLDKVALRDAVKIGASVASALRAAHAAAVTHRDIKPQNIVVTPDQQAKVLEAD